MNVLITGAKGFVGKNLVCALKNVRDGKDRSRGDLKIGTVWEYDLDTPESVLEEGCAGADFVFHLAGVNRPKDRSEFMTGNLGFSERVLELLRRNGNRCPVLLSSSAQASLLGRFAGSDYGKSKLAAEEEFFRYAAETGAEALVYRFPNLFGKWCRPGYNSAVATFCHNIARDLPITVSDPSVELELVYIDDLVDEMFAALRGEACRCDFDGLTPVPKPDGRYCCVPVSHRATLGQIVELLRAFRAQPETLLLPRIPEGSFAKKLYSAYLSDLPEDRVRFPLRMNCDARGSFTELLKTADSGQISVNISKPGITKGEHWHNSKWEFFIVVSGHGLIQERKIGTDEILNFEVSGERIEAVHMLPGWTHNIINLSDTEDLVTVMWANERFDPEHPDTFREPVLEKGND